MEQKLPSKFTQPEWDTLTSDLQSHPTTIDDYRKILNILHSYDHGKFDIHSMTLEDAKEYFDHLDYRVRMGTLSSRTAQRYKATLRSIATRMSHHHKQFPHYTNPFKNLIPHEVRYKTDYTEMEFVSHQDIQKMMSVLPSFHETEQFLFLFLVQIGLTPAQIQGIKILDFYYTPDERLLLSCTQKQGGFLNYQFTDSFAKELMDKVPSLGKNHDNRHFFLTPRHSSYSHRVLYSTIQSICTRANLLPIKPSQLVLYGMVRSFLIHTTPMEDKEHYDYLRQMEVIGDWDTRIPSNIQSQIIAIQKQLGPVALWRIVGYNHSL